MREKAPAKIVHGGHTWIEMVISSYITGSNGHALYITRPRLASVGRVGYTTHSTDMSTRVFLRLSSILFWFFHVRYKDSVEHEIERQREEEEVVDTDQSKQQRRIYKEKSNQDAQRNRCRFPLKRRNKKKMKKTTTNDDDDDKKK
jgi:hypothetical protein